MTGWKTLLGGLLKTAGAGALAAVLPALPEILNGVGGSAKLGAALVETGTSNGFVYVGKLVVNAVGLLQGPVSGTPSALQIFGYQWHRFILGSANTGYYVASLGHWSVQE